MSAQLTQITRCCRTTKSNTLIPTKKAVGKKTMNKKDSKGVSDARLNDKSKVLLHIPYKILLIRVIMPKNPKGSDDEF